MKQKSKGETVAVKVNLPKELHKKLRVKSILEEKTIQEVIESLVSQWVQS